MMFVKICGLTNREDALAAVDAGARALGFIFYAASPRHVTSAQLEPWVNEIPAEIWKVGVFVDEAPDVIEQIGSRVGLDVAQLHGCETPEPAIRTVFAFGKRSGLKDPLAPVPDYPSAESGLD